jgi:hypothetical protein
MPADFDWFEYRERDYVADVTQLWIGAEERPSQPH